MSRTIKDKPFHAKAAQLLIEKGREDIVFEERFHDDKDTAYISETISEIFGCDGVLHEMEGIYGSGRVPGVKSIRRNQKRSERNKIRAMIRNGDYDSIPSGGSPMVLDSPGYYGLYS